MLTNNIFTLTVIIKYIVLFKIQFLTLASHDCVPVEINTLKKLIIN